MMMVLRWFCFVMSLTTVAEMINVVTNHVTIFGEFLMNSRFAM